MYILRKNQRQASEKEGGDEKKNMCAYHTQRQHAKVGHFSPCRPRGVLVRVWLSLLFMFASSSVFVEFCSTSIPLFLPCSSLFLDQLYLRR